MHKIHLIKIDTNGFELPIIKGLIKTIKKDLPVMIVEVNKDQKKISQILKKYSIVKKIVKIHSRMLKIFPYFKE